MGVSASNFSGTSSGSYRCAEGLEIEGPGAKGDVEFRPRSMLTGDTWRFATQEAEGVFD